MDGAVGSDGLQPRPVPVRVQRSAIPRGFALVFDDLAAHDWGWVAFSHRGVIETGKIIDHKRVVTEHEGVKTVLVAGRLVEDTGDEARVFAWWADGRTCGGWARHPDDPVPAPFGGSELRKILTGEADWPRWARPDLGDDER